MNKINMLKITCGAQAAYYILTGLWPIIHIDSFEVVTGPKVDDWLVKTVGVLVIAIGLPLIFALIRKMITLELAILAVSAAVGLAAIDIYYSFNGIISPIYLADAAVQIGIAGIWVICFKEEKQLIQ
ncbi:MAG: hypothetical protein ACK40G_16010 [Cytophagaceae bacterium]